MGKSEIIEVYIVWAKKDIEKIGDLLENDENNQVLISEYGFRLGIVEGLERALSINEKLVN